MDVFNFQKKNVFILFCTSILTSKINIRGGAGNSKVNDAKPGTKTANILKGKG